MAKGVMAVSQTVREIPGPILIVEDQALIRRAWVEWVVESGRTAVEAATADEALGAVAQHRPSVAICDVSLGSGKSGVWLGGQLTVGPNPMQVIYATSHDMLPVDATLREGVSGYLLKPFDKRKLYAALDVAESELLARRRRASAELAVRTEMAKRRAHLYSRIDGLEAWERTDATTIVARLCPLGVPMREAFVSAFANRCGARLGLTMGERLDLMRAVELRNIGKLVMPAFLLEADRPLTSDERKTLATYVSEGEAVVARCGLATAAAWIGAMGEPSGWLSLDASPSSDGHGPGLTRVIAVFLAMTEARPYREPLSILDAVEQLRRGAGSLYHPAAVEALVSALAAQPL